MAVDIAYTDDRVTKWDETGDIETVTGESQIIQAIGIRLIEDVSLSAPATTVEALESRREKIAAVVRDIDVTQSPISVSIVSTDAEPDSNGPPVVQYRVETNRVSVDVTLQDT